MPDPVCPRHKKPMARNKRGWYCSTLIETLEDGTKVWCDYKPPQTAPVAAASPRGSSVSPPAPAASPRLQAAMSALESAAMVMQGRAVSATDLCTYAEELYAGFLKPMFFNQPRREPGEDDDLNF